MQEILVNWTLGDHLLRGKASVRIEKGIYLNAKASKYKPADTIDTLVAALRATPHIIDSPPPSAYLMSVDDQYYNYEIHFNCDISDIKVVELVKSNVNVEIAKLLAGHHFMIEHLKLVMVSSHQPYGGAVE
jgi:small-conductance mechanosensitive channel